MRVESEKKGACYPLTGQAEGVDGIRLPRIFYRSHTKKTSAARFCPVAVVFISYIEYQRIGRYTYHV